MAVFPRNLSGSATYIVVILVWMKSIRDILLRYSELNPIYYGDYIVNYSGGFVRRGLFGTLLIYIKTLTGLDAHVVILAYQASVLTLILYQTLRILKTLDKSPPLLLYLLLPIGFAFPIFDSFLAGRREELAILLNMFCITVNRSMKQSTCIFWYCLLVLITSLFHEPTGLCLLIGLYILYDRGIISKSALYFAFSYTVVIFVTLTLFAQRVENEISLCSSFEIYFSYSCSDWVWAKNYLSGYNSLEDNILTAMPIINYDGMLLHTVLVLSMGLAILYYLSVVFESKSPLNTRDFWLIVGPILLLTFIGDYGRWLRVTLVSVGIHLISSSRGRVILGNQRFINWFQWMIFPTLFISIQHANYPVVNSGYINILMTILGRVN